MLYFNGAVLNICVDFELPRKASRRKYGEQIVKMSVCNIVSNRVYAKLYFCALFDVVCIYLLHKLLREFYNICVINKLITSKHFGTNFQEMQ